MEIVCCRRLHRPNDRPAPWQTVLSFQQPSPFCHPERTRISYITALTAATHVVLPKENHTQPTEAATLNRKSGGAEGSAVPRASPGNAIPGSALGSVVF